MFKKGYLFLKNRYLLLKNSISGTTLAIWCSKRFFSSKLGTRTMEVFAAQKEVSCSNRIGICCLKRIGFKVLKNWYLLLKKKR